MPKLIKLSLEICLCHVGCMSLKKYVRDCVSLKKYKTQGKAELSVSIKKENS